MSNKEIVKELKLLRGKIGLDNPTYALSAVDCLIEELETEPVYTKEMHERGELPPVESRVLCQNSHHNDWSEFIVSGVSKGSVSGVSVMVSCPEISMMVKLDHIKPIQTQEEKDIEALMSLLRENNPFTISEIAKAIIKAGYSKRTLKEVK